VEYGQRQMAALAVAAATVYKDTLFIGWAGMDWAFQSAPRTIFAVDAQTGVLNGPSPTSRRVREDHRHRQCLASMSVDPKPACCICPPAPQSNFYGGDRGKNCAGHRGGGAGGRYRQSGLEPPAGPPRFVGLRHQRRPVLIDLHKDGQTVPALVQTTKQGYLFVLNRLTGSRFTRLKNARSASNVPGEQPSRPSRGRGAGAGGHRRMPGVSRIADIASGGYCSRVFHKLHYQGSSRPKSRPRLFGLSGDSGGVEWAAAR